MRAQRSANRARRQEYPGCLLIRKRGFKALLPDGEQMSTIA